MALVNEHFFKITGKLFILGYSEKGKYFQDNASQTGHHPARYRRRYAATSSSLYRSNA